MKRCFFIARSLGLIAMGMLQACSGPETFEWQQSYARRLPGGRLQWAPEPFVYRPGTEVRYIDFEGGDDTMDGHTPETAWKHHPWDRRAVATAAADSAGDTYVFKRGVTYRGTLRADSTTGRSDGLVRLTSDPSWGVGEARIAGSRAVTRGWRPLEPSAAPASMPSPEKVWVRDVPDMAEITALWVDGDEPVRVPLAREPDWTVTDPDDVMAGWAVWDDCEPVTVERRMLPLPQLGAERSWMTDSSMFTAARADAYEGARIWTEYLGLMGSPYPNPVDTYDPSRKAVRIGSCWSGWQRPVAGNRYFIENHPRFLDAPGEYWHDTTGGFLYLRLPGDSDPNESAVELAEQTSSITLVDQCDIEISGLTFGFLRTPQVHHRYWDIPDEDPACVKALGTAVNIHIVKNRFVHAHRAVWVQGADIGSRIEGIHIADNDMSRLDNDAIVIMPGGTKGKPGMGHLGRVRILRNRIREVGARPRRASHGHAVQVRYADLLTVAGNIISRTHGAGIFLHGGKGGKRSRPTPADELTRMLVMQNQVDYSCMTSNDWGGIETWQGGPCYIFDNVSRSPGGYWKPIDAITDENWEHFNGHWDERYEGKEWRGVHQARAVAGHWTRGRRNANSAGFAYAYYHDGAFKQYQFNNIGAGRSSDLSSRLLSTGAVHAVAGSFLITVVNNTYYRFGCGIKRGGTYSAPDLFLGNVFADMGDLFLMHQSPRQQPHEPKVHRENADPQSGGAGVQSPTLLQAWASNLFAGSPKGFGCVEESGRIRETLDDFNDALGEVNAIGRDAGEMAAGKLLRAPAGGDYRPVEGSQAERTAVKTFIPWGLSATVGEWQFRRIANEPDRIPGEHWYMTPDHRHRGMYKHLPRHELTAFGVGSSDYVEAETEDWIASALRFDGASRYCVLSDTAMRRDIHWDTKRDSGFFPGDQRVTLDIAGDDILIEAIVRVADGHTGGGIAGKEGENGYLLSIDESGKPRCTITVGAAPAVVATAARGVGDGAWHHLLVEVDRREDKRIRFYVDGRQVGADSEGAVPGPETSLSNTGDFLVGRDAAGNYLKADIDFLRVCRATLEAARTGIEELYAWEFNGPHLRTWWGGRVGG